MVGVGAVFHNIKPYGQMTDRDINFCRDHFDFFCCSDYNYKMIIPCLFSVILIGIVSSYPWGNGKYFKNTIKKSAKKIFTNNNFQNK